MYALLTTLMTLDDKTNKNGSGLEGISQKHEGILEVTLVEYPSSGERWLYEFLGITPTPRVHAPENLDYLAKRALEDEEA